MNNENNKKMSEINKNQTEKEKEILNQLKENIEDRITEDGYIEDNVLVFNYAHRLTAYIEELENGNFHVTIDILDDCCNHYNFLDEYVECEDDVVDMVAMFDID